VTQAVGAIMLIIGMATSQTPSPVPGDMTHVMIFPYATVSECKKDLQNIPLSSDEQQIEIKYKVRTIRSCSPVDSNFWFLWSHGGLDPMSSDQVVVDTGPYVDP
jgi:hypothetical protein